jgi:hypothetical protein
VEVKDRVDIAVAMPAAFAAPPPAAAAPPAGPDHAADAAAAAAAQLVSEVPKLTEAVLAVQARHKENQSEVSDWLRLIHEHIMPHVPTDKHKEINLPTSFYHLVKQIEPHLNTYISVSTTARMHE